MSEQTRKYIIFADGGSRNNPGEAAYGFVIYDENKKEIFKEGKRIGIATNNVAEYSGVIAALRWIKENGTKNPEIEFFVDSTLVANQLMGRFKIKNENLRNLYFTIKTIEQELESKIVYSQVPRAQNSAADRLVNLALDNKL